MPHKTQSHRTLVFLILVGSVFSGLPTTPLQADEATPNALIPPPVEWPVPVEVSLWAIDIVSIDEKEQVFHVGGRIDMSWTDPRQAFDPAVVGVWSKEYQGEGALEVLDRTVWWPDFEILDSVDSRDRMHVNLTIHNSGDIYYRERFYARIQQDFLLDDFPFDSHAISFAVEPFTYGGGYVKYVTDPDEDRGASWQPTEWEVSAPVLEVTNPTEHACFDDEDEAVTPREDGPCGDETACPGDTTCENVYTGFPDARVSFEISRKSGFYTGNIILPLLLILIISSAVFHMDLETIHLGDRLSVSFTALLTVVAFDFVTSESLPKLSYSTALDRVVTAAYVFMALTILANVVADRIHRGGERGANRAQRLNRRLAWLAPALFVFSVVVLTI